LRKIVFVLLIGCAPYWSGCERATPATATAPVAKAEPINESEVRARAEKGDATAQNALGEALLRGEGVKRNVKEALRMFESAAGQGNAAALYNLATLYEAGQAGPVDDAKAAEFYRKAADQGHAGAQYGLAVCYSEGRGVARDNAAALKWAQESARGGEPLAQFALGARYRDGVGVAVDSAAAWGWFSLAASQGLSDAGDAQVKLEKTISREQINAGRKFTNEFRPRQTQ
jgi:TPR repeat protein